MTFQVFLKWLQGIEDCEHYSKESWSLTLWADDYTCDGTDGSSIFPHTIIDAWDAHI